MGIRFSCPLEHVSHVCQVLAGDMLDWVDPPPPRLMATAFADVGSPSIELEAIGIERVLISLATAVAARIPRNFCQRFCLAECEFVAIPLVPVRTGDRRLLVSESAERWAADYRAAFYARYDTPAQRTRRGIDTSFGSVSTVHALADAAAITRRTLERQFRDEIGMSIAKYRNEVRLRAAIRRLQTSTDCVEAIALSLGWRSKKGLYDALERAGLTPRMVRAFPADGATASACRASEAN